MEKCARALCFEASTRPNPMGCPVCGQPDDSMCDMWPSFVDEVKAVLRVLADQRQSASR